VSALSHAGFETVVKGLYSVSNRLWHANMTINRFSRVKSPVVGEKGEMSKLLCLSILMLGQRNGVLLKDFCKGGTDPLLLALPRLSRLSTPGLAYHTARSLSQLDRPAATAQSWMSVALRCHASLQLPSSFVALSSIRRCQTIDDPHIRHILILALVQLSMIFYSFPCHGRW